MIEALGGELVGLVIGENIFDEHFVQLVDFGYRIENLGDLLLR